MLSSNFQSNYCNVLNYVDNYIINFIFIHIHTHTHTHIHIYTGGRGAFKVLQAISESTHYSK